jgi:hypothetical protein
LTRVQSCYYLYKRESWSRTLYGIARPGLPESGVILGRWSLPFASLGTGTRATLSAPRAFDELLVYREDNLLRYRTYCFSTAVALLDIHNTYSIC